MVSEQIRFEDIDEGKEYKEFLEKFKPKKTTDDCYTPETIYEIVADWVSREYGVRHEDMVRPFWPGGDYQREEYPEGCCVVDNPPFSILSQIVSWYEESGIRFFLFAPGLSCFKDGFCAVTANCDVIYENGANVRTSFITNLDRTLAARTAPDLTKAVDEESSRLAAKGKKSLPKYEFPDHVVTAAKMGWMSIHGEDYRVRRKDCAYIRCLDSMRDAGKSGIFGGAYLLNTRAAAERAAAERAAVERSERWQLSPRELAAIAILDKRG